MASGDRRRLATRTGAPVSASTTSTPTARSIVRFPDMFEPLTIITRGPPAPSATSFRTETASAMGAPTPHRPLASQRATVTGQWRDTDQGGDLFAV